MISNLFVVTLDYFYHEASNPLAWECFGKIAELRKQGYGPDYPNRFLPLDAGDFIARHHLFCLKESNSYLVIGGFKNLTLSRCDQYSIDLPILKLVKASKSKVHCEAVEKIISDTRASQGDLLYSSSLTIKKDFRKGHIFSEQIFKTVFALVYEDFIESKSTFSITGAVPRFKTDQLFKKVGYQSLSDENQNPLPNIAKVAAGGEPVHLMGFDCPSFFMKQQYRDVKQILDNRLWIPSEIEKLRKQIA